ncbi:hypothetical protein DSO57_1000040 [Entomophthora muscae]|uniref:Uncharacterized protein n=1 Tax=Entomophthora muscae TaxID=34485 RepID=A0ACC2SMC0_9FUNG|nr:hypothetical protein DSO57_1000040 [Entomophthora muscae]
MIQLFGFLILRNSLAPLMLVASDPTVQPQLVEIILPGPQDFLLCVCAAPQNTTMWALPAEPMGCLPVSSQEPLQYESLTVWDSGHMVRSKLIPNSATQNKKLDHEEILGPFLLLAIGQPESIGSNQELPTQPKILGKQKFGPILNAKFQPS